MLAEDLWWFHRMAILSHTKRSHYVHQGYLKNFCDLEGKLYCYDLSTKKSFQTDPKNISIISNYYNPTLEGEFSKLESEVTGILNSLISEPSLKLSDTDFQIFCEFRLIWQKRTKSLVGLECLQSGAKQDFLLIDCLMFG